MYREPEPETQVGCPNLANKAASHGHVSEITFRAETRPISEQTIDIYRGEAERAPDPFHAASVAE